jgi:hypothetical protein
MAFSPVREIYQEDSIGPFRWEWPDTWVQERLFVASSLDLQAMEYLRLCDGWEGLNYFLARYARTMDEHDEIIPFKAIPYDVKPYMEIVAWCWYHIKKPIFLCKSRQVMLTWLVSSMFLWDAMFHSARRLGIQSKKDLDSEAVVQRCFVIYENLPAWLRSVCPASKSYNKLDFPYNSSVINGYPQGGDQVRQFVFSALFSDETGFQGFASDSYMAAQPTIKGGGRYIAVSTANPGFFEMMYKDQIEGIRVKPVFRDIQDDATEEE